MSVLLREPTNVRKAAPIKAATIIAITAPPAEVEGRTGAWVGSDSIAVARIVGEDVGQGVDEGRMVGVSVGKVEVGVYEECTMMDCSG